MTQLTREVHSIKPKLTRFFFFFSQVIVVFCLYIVVFFHKIYFRFSQNSVSRTYTPFVRGAQSHHLVIKFCSQYDEILELSITDSPTVNVGQESYKKGINGLENVVTIHCFRYTSSFSEIRKTLRNTNFSRKKEKRINNKGMNRSRE